MTVARAHSVNPVLAQRLRHLVMLQVRRLQDARSVAQMNKVLSYKILKILNQIINLKFKYENIK